MLYYEFSSPVPFALDVSQHLFRIIDRFYLVMCLDNNAIFIDQIGGAPGRIVFGVKIQNHGN